MTAFEWTIAEAIEYGHYVTCRTIGGMRTATVHGTTNEDRQKVIDDYDEFERNVK